MLRYHKNVYFKTTAPQELKAYTDCLNLKAWRYTSHSIDNLKHRAIDVEKLLYFIKGLQLKSDDIFEYYHNGFEIEKACYRVNFDNVSIILVISKNKELVTIYLNSLYDNHETLKENIYCKQ